MVGVKLEGVCSVQVARREERVCAGVWRRSKCSMCAGNVSWYSVEWCVVVWEGLVCMAIGVQPGTEK